MLIQYNLNRLTLNVVKHDGNVLAFVIVNALFI